MSFCYTVVRFLPVVIAGIIAGLQVFFSRDDEKVKEVTKTF